jgi:glucose-6-phosphate-specific signal transduction histidine kinase
MLGYELTTEESIRYDVQRQLSDDAFAELEAIYLICALRATATDDAQALATIRKRAAAILRRRDEEAS